mmetsp:Transcript_21926/g.53878  ORF Transcript_21926/g.53878 Transcript_21926/m.53878 type:complete len:160 (-) Transcript_21926:281-760(-)
MSMSMSKFYVPCDPEHSAKPSARDRPRTNDANTPRFALGMTAQALLQRGPPPLREPCRRFCVAHRQWHMPPSRSLQAVTCRNTTGLEGHLFEPPRHGGDGETAFDFAHCSGVFATIDSAWIALCVTLRTDTSTKRAVTSANASLLDLARTRRAHLPAPC